LALHSSRPIDKPSAVGVEVATALFIMLNREANRRLQDSKLFVESAERVYFTQISADMVGMWQ